MVQCFLFRRNQALSNGGLNNEGLFYVSISSLSKEWGPSVWVGFPYRPMRARPWAADQETVTKTVNRPFLWFDNLWKLHVFTQNCTWYKSISKVWISQGLQWLVAFCWHFADIYKKASMWTRVANQWSPSREPIDIADTARHLTGGRHHDTLAARAPFLTSLLSSLLTSHSTHPYLMVTFVRHYQDHGAKWVLFVW